MIYGRLVLLCVLISSFHDSGPGVEMSSKTDELRELAKLKEEGILSDDEFNQKKAEFLSAGESTPTAPVVASSLDFSLIRNKTGYAAIAYMVSMFLPWMSLGYASASGWTVADADKLSAVFYLVYLIPIGSGFVIYSLLMKKPIAAWARYTGLVPPVLLIGALWKLVDAAGGRHFNKILGHFFEDFLFKTMSVGFWLAVISGLVLVFSLRSNDSLVEEVFVADE